MNEVWRWIWTIGALTFGIGEIFTAGFFLAPFGIGALVAAVLAWAEIGLAVQWIAFFVVSMAALAYLQRFIWHQDDEAAFPVGATRFVGATGIVLDPIDPKKGTGMIRVETEEWRATTDGDGIKKGSSVRVTEIRGTRLVVTDQANE